MPLPADTLAILKKINKEHKRDDVIVLGSEIAVPKRFTSGSLGLDIALGGGWAANRFVEVYGYESHGKTTVVHKSVAANQELDKNFATFWVASEDYDAENAEALGVDTSRVAVYHNNSMEEAYAETLRMIEARAFDCYVIDSYPALIPDEEAVKQFEGNTMALGARNTARFFRLLGELGARSVLHRNDRPYVGFFVNQVIADIGGWAPNGQPETTPGGKRKNFYFSVRVKVKRDEYIYEANPTGPGKVAVGQVIKVQTIKNKTAAPMKTASIDFYFTDAPEHGIPRGSYDVAKDMVTMGIMLGVVEKRGGWFYVGNEKWQGKDALLDSVREDMDLRAKIESETRKAAEALTAKQQTIEEELNDEVRSDETEVGQPGEELGQDT